MNMILHNLKVAIRNLLKYKLQTIISVLSIAIGIVTLSFTHSLMSRYRLPQIFDEPYADRTYIVKFHPTNEETNSRIEQEKRMFRVLDAEGCAKIDEDIIRALKGNGGLRNAEKLVVPNVITPTLSAEFHLTDSTIRQGNIIGKIMDPNMPDYSGITSAVTGKKIGDLKAGEAIICEDAVKKIFGDKDPIGAVQVMTDEWQNIPVTVKDVYSSTSILEPYFTNCDMFYCIADSIEENYRDMFNFTQWVNIVMKKGTTEKELEKEIDSRVAPLGYKSELTSFLSGSPQIEKAIPIRILVNVIGSLILLAAIIGFLRIEIQLFYTRRRELALRIVNGAKRRQVFGCIFSETSIVIGFSIIIALLLGALLQRFFDTKFIGFMNHIGYGLRIADLWQNSIIIGTVILIICSLITWIALKLIARERHGILSNIQKSNSHIFRNAMLCIQIVICIVFVCCAFTLYKGTENILRANNIPEKDDIYSKYLYIEPYMVSDANHLLDEIKALPDIDKMLMYSQYFTALKELADDPELSEKLDGNVYYQFYATLDTSVLSTLGKKVKWNNNVDKNQCFILSEKTYEKFQEYGILDHSTLTMKYHKITLPVGGTIDNLPYEGNGSEFIIAIYPGWEKSKYGYILAPKEGREKELENNIRKIIEREEPQAFNEMLFKFREYMNPMVGLAETVRSAGWILGIVSLIICAMSIFSTITLDTRGRKKEVAIRKVNGAKNRDIYLMFGRIYVVIISTALVISIPVCILFNKWIDNVVKDIVPTSTLSPILPIISGSAIIIILIGVIVVCQIRRVLQTDTAKNIAKE